MTAARVIAWRHGRTGHNHTGVWQGQLDVPLDEVGLEQAGQGGAALAASLEPGEQVVVVSSDLTRASRTAGALAELLGLEIRLDARLREVYAGAWQGLTRDEIVAAGMGEQLAAWRRGEDVPVGGGERRSEVSRRGAAAVVEHAAAMDGGTLVVVAHGGLLRGTILTVLGLPGERWDILDPIRNAHWAELRPAEPTWRLCAYNVQATPSANRFGVVPPHRGRLAEPQR